jgi:hypothetical protein
MAVSLNYFHPAGLFTRQLQNKSIEKESVLQVRGRNFSNPTELINFAA